MPFWVNSTHQKSPFSGQHPALFSGYGKHYLNWPIKWDGSLKAKSTLFNLFIRKTSQFLCYERLLNMTYVAYKKSIFPQNAILVALLYSDSNQALSRLSVYKIPAVYLLGAKNVCFCTIRDFGSPTNDHTVYISSIESKDLMI